MLNINELKAKAALIGMAITDADNGLYQIYTETGYAISHPANVEHLNNAAKCGVFDDFEESDDIEFLCTNGANSSFSVSAKNADEALAIAVNRFDNDSDYVLPISVQSECGLTGVCTIEPATDLVYSDDDMGLNDDY